MVGPTNSVVRRKPSEIDEVIMDILTRSTCPIGAYEIAKQANEKSHRLSPTQVYRSLGRLMKSSKVEQVASLNAYLIAAKKSRVHLLCRECGTVKSVEENKSNAALMDVVASVMFRARTTHIEIAGQCKSCRSKRKANTKSRSDTC